RRLRFGMNVVSLALRDPVLLAKQCATIDVLSEGRLLPAFGIGSPLGPEWTALDIDTKTRGRRTDESLEIIARLWREDSVDFAGKHYRLKGASISPKPVDRKSTRLNSSHLGISYAVFCLKKNTQRQRAQPGEPGRVCDLDDLSAHTSSPAGSPGRLCPRRLEAAPAATRGRAQLTPRHGAE